MRCALTLPKFYCSSLSVVSRTFSARAHAMCIFDIWVYHPHPVVPNFIAVAAVVVELARGEKLRTQSLTQSLSHSLIELI